MTIGPAFGEPADDRDATEDLDELGFDDDGLAADDALLDAVAAGTHVVAEPAAGNTGHTGEDVERELAATLIAWRSSVCSLRSTCTHDVDRATTVVDGARPAERPRRLLPTTAVLAAVVAVLAAVTLSTTTPAPPPVAAAPAGHADTMAAADDLDEAASAWARGEVRQAHAALTRADLQLPRAPDGREAERLRLRSAQIRGLLAAATDPATTSTVPRPQVTVTPASPSTTRPPGSGREPALPMGAADEDTFHEHSPGHSTSDPAPSDHPSTVHPSTDHPSTDHPSTVHPSTDHSAAHRDASEEHTSDTDEHADEDTPDEDTTDEDTTDEDAAGPDFAGEDTAPPDTSRPTAGESRPRATTPRVAPSTPRTDPTPSSPASSPPSSTSPRDDPPSTDPQRGHHEDGPARDTSGG